MGKTVDHTDLEVWGLSLVLAKMAYHFAGNLPSIERYALADQIRRAAASGPANIAEGYGRGSRGDFARSLRIARGSLAELHSHISLAHDLGYGSSDHGEVLETIDRVRRMINALLGSLKRRNQPL